MIHHGRAENNRQSRISGLVAFLSGQTLVLLVILSAHFWIWTFYSPRTFPLNGSCSILCNTAMMFFDLCYALKTFCNNLPSTRMSVQYNWPVTSIVWYYLGKKKTTKKTLLQLFDQPEKEVVYYYPFVSYESSGWSFS